MCSSDLYGMYVKSNFLLPLYGNESIGATNVPFYGVAANRVWLCYNASKYAALRCNSDGKLLVNGTVIA